MKRLAIVLLVGVLFALPSAARADVAPPINPPGPNLQPGAEVTQVRMAAETVVIAVHSDTTPESLGSAAVTADFTMHNLGTQDENLAVRFPIAGSDGRGNFPELTGLVVKVDGKSVSTHRVSYPEPRYMGEDVPWAEFQVSFPAGKDVAIEVKYGLNGSGYPPYTAFYYVLATGAGWKGTIGSADIALRLPYPASEENIVLGQEIGWATTTPGGVIEGNEMRWHFEDFEPGPDGVVNNMEIGLVAPSAWQVVLTERGHVTATPKDGEAWGRLAKAYKDIFFMNKGFREGPGGEELYQSSVEAYQNCLKLLPKDAQWHAGFADLLASHAYWDAFSGGATNADTTRALEEIRTALQLAPSDSKVQQIAEQISNMFPDALVKSGTNYDFPWLTATPTPGESLPLPDTATPAGTAQAALQATVAVPPTAVPSSAPASKPGSSPCGSAALVPLVIVLWAAKKRRH